VIKRGFVPRQSQPLRSPANVMCAGKVHPAGLGGCKSCMRPYRHDWGSPSEVSEVFAESP